jgi:hypothetical protein
LAEQGEGGGQAPRCGRGRPLALMIELLQVRPARAAPKNEHGNTNRGAISGGGRHSTPGFRVSTALCMLPSSSTRQPQLGTRPGPAALCASHMRGCIQFCAPSCLGRAQNRDSKGRGTPWVVQETKSKRRPANWVGKSPDRPSMPGVGSAVPRTPASRCAGWAGSDPTI